MEILYRSGKLADLKKESEILPDYIRAAKADVYPELRRDVLEELDMKQTIIVSHEAKMESYVENIIRIAKSDNISRIIS